jgi:hypothetical protein
MESELQMKCNCNVKAIRHETKGAAGPLLADLKISEPGDHLLVLQGSTPKPSEEVTFNLVRPNAPISTPLTIRLREKAVESEDCQQPSEKPARGFSLELEFYSVPEVITFRDGLDSPESEKCVLGYTIAGALRHKNVAGFTYVVLLRVQSVGLEGPDTRFLAVARVCRNRTCALEEWQRR